MGSACSPSTGICSRRCSTCSGLAACCWRPGASAALAAGGFWYLRNLAQAGNPLPWVKSIGPLSLPSPSQGLHGRPQFSIVHYLGDTAVIRHWFLSGLHDALGVLWPLIGVLALAGLVLALARGNPVLKLIGLAGLSLVVVWLLQGASAEGPPGRPV